MRVIKHSHILSSACNETYPDSEQAQLRDSVITEIMASFDWRSVTFTGSTAGAPAKAPECFFCLQKKRGMQASRSACVSVVQPSCLSYCCYSLEKALL